MNNADSILSMTKHASYVWPSYAIAAVVLVGLVVLSLAALKRTRAELDRIEAQMPRESDET
ncbi:MAG: heme exporter protein CcmD [Rhodospirillales bacterium]